MPDSRTSFFDLAFETIINFFIDNQVDLPVRTPEQEREQFKAARWQLQAAHIKKYLKSGRNTK